MKMKKLLLIPALAATASVAGASIPINGFIESKCVIQSDTPGRFGNPTVDELSTKAAEGGVMPIIRYDIITASKYKAVITTPTNFSASPSLSDSVDWTSTTVAGQMSDSEMSVFNSDKAIYNNGHTTMFDLVKAGSVWFNVTSEAKYGVGKAFPSGNYTALIVAECIAK
jgi:hypothetical protein